MAHPCPWGLPEVQVWTGDGEPRKQEGTTNDNSVKTREGTVSQMWHSTLSSITREGIEEGSQLQVYEDGWP